MMIPLPNLPSFEIENVCTREWEWERERECVYVRGMGHELNQQVYQELTFLGTKLPFPLIRNMVGLNPTIPQKAAGIRIDPPISLPKAIGTHFMATRAASPPEDPPKEGSTSWRN